MKKRDLLIIAVVFAVLITFVFLLKRSTQPAPDIGKQSKRPATITLKIKNLEITPKEPTSSDIIRANASLEKPTRSHFKYSYRWFVDGNEISSKNSSVLSKNFYRKNSRIYCRVKAVLGTIESKEEKSKTIKILNSSPVIQHHPLGKFNVPGRFTYKILARDPDGDSLEYQLVSPMGKGINVDAATGEVTWDIPALPQLPEITPTRFAEGEESMEAGDTEGEPEGYPELKRQLIVVDVVDSDGGKTRVSIKLDLVQGKEITE